MDKKKRYEILSILFTIIYYGILVVVFYWIVMRGNDDMDFLNEVISDSGNKIILGLFAIMIPVTLKIFSNHIKEMEEMDFETNSNNLVKTKKEKVIIKEHQDLEKGHRDLEKEHAELSKEHAELDKNIAILIAKFENKTDGGKKSQNNINELLNYKIEAEFKLLRLKNENENLKKDNDELREYIDEKN